MRSTDSLPLPTGLSDGRVRLRPFRPADAPAVFAACADPLVQRFTTFPTPRRESDSRQWIESQGWLRAQGVELDLAIVPAADAADTAVGAIGIAGISFQHQRAQLGYWLAPEARGHGLALAALRLLSRWGMEPPLRLERLELHIDVGNHPSRGTAERAGFRFEAVLRSHLQAKGRRWDVAVYSLLPGDEPPPPPGDGSSNPRDRRPDRAH